VVEAVVISVVAVVVEVVLAAGSLGVPGVKPRVGTSNARRCDGAVVPTRLAVGRVVRRAMVEDRGDVVRSHEGQGQKCPAGGRRTRAAPTVLERAVGHLAGIRPPHVVAGFVARRARVGRLHGNGGQQKGQEGEQIGEFAHSPWKVEPSVYGAGVTTVPAIRLTFANGMS